MELKALLQNKSYRWLVTGAAGFIGGHLVETLLENGQTVVGLDSGAAPTRSLVRSNWSYIQGDITDLETCKRAMKDADFVLHQAALASVPLSLEQPEAFLRVNVEGSKNILVAARELKVKKVVLASTSAVYGDDPEIPKREEKIGKPLSPYASTKRRMEELAQEFEKNFGLSTVILRYFNVYGPGQSAESAYAAVIAKWADRILQEEPCVIFGDGKATRDFCYIEDVVRANVLAALSDQRTNGRVYNIGSGSATTMIDLHSVMAQVFRELAPKKSILPLKFQPSRAGDILISVANIDRAKKELRFSPQFDLASGLKKFVSNLLR